MANYLLTVRGSGPDTAPSQVEAPSGYLVEWSQEPSRMESEGLEHWQIELQIAGGVVDWARSDDFDKLWQYLENALLTLELRPSGFLSIHARTDPHRIGIHFAYLSAHQLGRAKETLSQRIDAAKDAKGKQLTADIELTL